MPTQKKVRVYNQTIDNTSIRVYILSIDPMVRMMVDVQPGSFAENIHMSQGHRGVIVYDDFQETVIVHGDFVLANQNVKLIVTGDAGSGYSLAYAAYI